MSAGTIEAREWRRFTPMQRLARYREVADDLLARGHAYPCWATREELDRFLADGDPRKREKLVDALLDRPEYADHWANKWVDLLRPNPYRVGIKAVLNYDV